jgi:uncharacterized 2Fe-2S/4Fe-4S cluster protein (DUF4445 family)
MPSKTDPIRVLFTPSGKRGEFARGTNLLAAARQLGVDLDSVCGGRGICGRCKVRIHQGASATQGLESALDHLSPLSDPERRYAERRSLDEDQRLSCHAILEGDCIVDVPPESQLHRQVIRKAFESHTLELDPVLRLHYVEVQPPSLEEPSGDLERLLSALEEEWALSGMGVDPGVLSGLQACLREEEFRVTVAVRDGREVVGLWSGLREQVLGVAVDVGSTTIAAHLCDLTSGEVLGSHGAMNPQIRFGEDLMSRVSHVMLNPGSELDMTRVVREAVDDLIRDLTRDAGAEPSDILEIVLVANPIMHHLFLGISPVHLGQAPFALATDGAVQVRATRLGLGVHPGARAYWLPCIAGHVGADAAGMLLAEAPWESDAVTLLVDVGTNAEILLAGGGRLLGASSPTGPAFEGAQISCGQRATAGAIERVRVDQQTLEPRFKVIGCEAWSDQPGFEDELGPQGVTGICGTGIIEAVAELFLAGVIRSDGLIDGGAAERSARVAPDERTFAYTLCPGTPVIRISQNDIRAVQLAKAALYAGIRLLMDRLGVDGVDQIRLAGAFGSHIDVKYAMVLGMIPDCELAAVSSAGNAAGTGAVAALLNGDARRTIENQVRRVEKIETAVESAFQEHFVAAMALPHSSHTFPELGKKFELPEPSRRKKSRAR